jgi:hypothetical protein
MTNKDLLITIGTFNYGYLILSLVTYISASVIALLVGFVSNALSVA